MSETFSEITGLSNKSKKLAKNKRRRLPKSKKSKQKKEKLSFKLLPKDSKGISNWDHLSQILQHEKKDLKIVRPLKRKKGFRMELSNPAFFSGTQNGYSSIHVASNSRHNVGFDNVQSRGNNFSSPIRDVANTISSTHNRRRNYSKLHLAKNPAVEHKQENATLGTPVSDNKNRYSRFVAMDCEMVGTGSNGSESMIARVSLVNRNGDCIYDEYVKPKVPITDYRTAISGIRPSDLIKGKDLYMVQNEVLQILENKILIGHALKNDLDVLFISHPKSMIRDTARYKPFRELFGGQTPSLKRLAAKLLDVEIQTGEHSSVEDARAAMQIYLSNKREWERNIKFQRRNNNFKEQRHQHIVNNFNSLDTV